MPKTLNLRLHSSSIKNKEIVFSDVVLLPKGEWNAFVGWRDKGFIKMSYGHGGSTAEESITRLERDLITRYV